MAQRFSESVVCGEDGSTMLIQCTSTSADDTQALGERVGRCLQAGDVICLYGELGSGKTVFVKGLAKGLGVPQESGVRSPSFVLIHRYEGRVPLYHADLYRLDGPADIDEIGLREWLGGDGVAVIEWADKLEAGLPAARLDVTLRHVDTETRQITLHPLGQRARRCLERCQGRGERTDVGDFEGTSAG
jgi:tRNA threonylcarbamoyladenosine biosynthesis protein TsaE